MNFLELINKAKFYAKSPQIVAATPTTEVDSAIPLARWAELLNSSQDFHMNEVITAANEFFGTLATISFVAGTQEYSLPGNMVQLRCIERTDSDMTRMIQRDIINNRLRFEPVNGTTNPLLYTNYAYLWGNLVGFIPKPTGSYTDNINVLYIRRLAQLIYGVCTAVVGHADQLTLTDPPYYGTLSKVNDYYNDAYIEIVSATGGAAAGAGQKRKITDYDGATGIVTLESAFSPAVSATTVVYTLVCEIPEEHHDAMAMYAATLAKTADDENISNISALHLQKLEQMKTGLAQRNSSGPRYVNYVDY